MSIFSSMRYCLGSPTDKTNLWAALIFMPLGLFFDFFDGKVARWRGKSSLMGQELDSLADLVCSHIFFPRTLRHALARTDCRWTHRRLDLVWRGPGVLRLRPRSPHPC